MASSYLEPIPPALRELLALLATRCADVSFPEADGRSLADEAAAVRAAAAEARRLDEEAERAYRALEEQQRLLLAKATRAARYARIYAANDRALAAAVDAIALPVDPSSSSPPFSSSSSSSTPPAPARKPAAKKAAGRLKPAA